MILSVIQFYVVILQVADLSSEFFHLVPQDGYAYEKVEPVGDLDNNRRQMGMIHNLLEYEMLARVIAGAQYKIKGKIIVLLG